MMAEAAKYNVDSGAHIIDINMGCPAKKICNVAAGSALLKDEPLVARIVDAVVRAVNVPVTLKIRTGWSKDNRNALRIARIAEDHGIQSLAMHGRTRACMYTGDAEYDTIRAVKQSVGDPGGRQRRHHHAREGEVRARVHRRGRRHDRPRRPGPPLDLPRDRALPGDRREARPAPGGGDPRRADRAPARPVRVLRHTSAARGSRASTSGGTRRGSRIPPCSAPA